ncbi:MAG: eukaryotic-like serine/threonine-protein kinase [Myxococcales bacterium]|jgi:serine/threonine-protein kinase|nr:eukaryotic-like serine/threonine-protein kinase [Myxococcales bacterium]
MAEAPQIAPSVAPGDVIAGKYRILGPLGAGGMAFVFAATHERLGHKVAIKFLSADPRDVAAAERFAREAHIVAELTSEQVPGVIDLGTLPDGTSYMVMEFLEGHDFEEVLAKRRRLPAGEAVDYILQACVGVAEAHSRGIVHRDIKPGNLFLTQRHDGSPLVKILDFGISKRVVGADTRLTQTGSSFGSPLYMSPEQLRDAKSVDARTDIWALGMVLYELIAGVAAFESETLHEAIAKIAADPHLPLRSRIPEVTPELDAVISRCLAKRREERPQSIPDLARALAAFASASAAATYLPRVCGSLERIPASVPATRMPSSTAQATAQSTAPSVPPSIPPPGSRTERVWNTTMRPPPGRRRRAAVLAAAGVLGLGALAAIPVVRYRARIVAGSTDAALTNDATAAAAAPPPQPTELVPPEIVLQPAAADSAAPNRYDGRSDAGSAHGHLPGAGGPGAAGPSRPGRPR